MLGFFKFFVLGALGLVGTAMAQQFPPTAMSTATPRFIVASPQAERPIELARLRIDSEIVGLAAHTRVLIELYNPNARVLEGEVNFPLRPNQRVTGFSLDIDGELRSAVPVEKALGRQVFEDVTRTRVDPALLETTEGNSYKLRVYPLPPQGTRRVLLEISETLVRSGLDARAALDYQLPLQFAQVVRKLEAVIRLPGADPLAVAARLGAERLALQRDGDGVATLTLVRSDYVGLHPLQVAAPAGRSQPWVTTGKFRDETYFYAEMPVTLAPQPRPAPRTLAILWDASGSAQARDRARELAVLDGYLDKLKNVEVDLLVVRDVAEPVQRFSVAGGNWRALRQYLEQLVYDGATDAGSMVVPAGAELALLFSDGVATFGSKGLPTATVPLFALTSSAVNDPVRLRHAAQASGATLLDLTVLDAEQAVSALRTAYPRLINLQASGATDLVSAGVYAQEGRLALGGRMLEPRAQLEITLQAADGSRTIRNLAVTVPTANVSSATPSLAAHRWAAMKLEELDADRERHAAAIRRIGITFSLATSGTSLIVLDSVADYARYEIEPPVSLRPAYDQLLVKRRSENLNAAQLQLDRIAAQFAEKQAWWTKVFPKNDLPKAASVPPAAAGRNEDAERLRSTMPQAMATPAPPPVASTASRLSAPPPASTGDGGAAAASIQLKKWAPDSSYARRLRAAAPQDMYAVYLDERPSYTTSTAFYLDAADIFFERGQPALGLRIMSNLAEMDLGNRHILRILAYRLLQAGQVRQAIPMLEKVLALAPYEPQSFRDLALALADDGQEQAAIDRLWTVISKPWNNRFPGIELIALAELNAIHARVVAAGRPTLDTRNMDPRLMRNLPLDLRAVLTWDADNTDIDLWVIDPNEERAYFAKPLTYQGGRVSSDFTGGYGPEEFSLRHAKPGTYTVRAQFYGHRQQLVAPATTLMLKLTGGFGTPAQKDSDTVLRLSGAGQEVTVGTFEVHARQGAALAEPPVKAASAPVQLQETWEAQVRAFETTQAIVAWPRVRLCGYERPWGAQVMGTVLEVRTYVEGGVRRASGTTALRNDTSCHVMPRHSLENWPADLDSGLYVVAARVHEAEQGVFKPWRLQILGVLRETEQGSKLARSLAEELDRRQQ